MCIHLVNGFFPTGVGYPMAEKMMRVTEFGSKLLLISQASELGFASLLKTCIGYFLCFLYINELVSIQILKNDKPGQLMLKS